MQARVGLFFVLCPYNNSVTLPSRAAALTAAALLAAATLSGQSAPPTPLMLVSSDGARPLATVLSGDTELIALDDVAAVFGATVREEAETRAISIAYRGRTIVLSQDQALASIGGRLVSLPAPPLRVAGRWHVPVEFLGRALGAIYDVPLEVRKASRLVLRGALRAPRVVVRHDVAGSQARVTLDVAPPTPHQVSQAGSRVLVRFEADLLDATLPAIQSHGLVHRVLVEGASIVVELGPRFGSLRAADVTGGPEASRVVLDLFATAETGPSPAGPDPAPAAPPLPTTQVRTIVVDPGHGGDDAGARGPRGTLEKAVTLSTARRLKAALEARLGARVLLTRDGDRAVALDERAALANNNKAELFISLHANQSRRATVAGAEVFYLALDHTDDEVRRATEGEAVAMPVFGGGTRAIDVILWEMAQARHLERSAGLARAVEANLRGTVPLSPRALQQAPLRVLVGANMPAVLIELGYLSHAEQETALASAPFQARVAQAITDAVAGFFQGSAP